MKTKTRKDVDPDSFKDRTRNREGWQAKRRDLRRAKAKRVNFERKGWT